MKKTYAILIAFVLVLAVTGIAYCYPPAGTDTMNPTTATVELNIIGIGSETLTVTGPTVVARSNPYDPGDGHMKIDTEIISMNLTGTSSLVGPITIIESPTKPSTGYIRQENAGENFPAYSYFDVFVEIQTTLPFPLSTLHNDVPAPMEATIYSIPPWGSTYTSTAENIPLKNQQDNIIGFITHVSHKIPPAPPVGGIAFPADKLALLAPYIILAALIAIGTVLVAVYRRRLFTQGG
jgi:hypothetical protein